MNQGRVNQFPEDNRALEHHALKNLLEASGVGDKIKEEAVLVAKHEITATNPSQPEFQPEGLELAITAAHSSDLNFALDFPNKG